MKKINVVIYGATGSIGRSTLSIISKNLDKINIEGITCNKNILKLLKIAKSYDIKKIGFNEKFIHKLNKSNLNKYLASIISSALFIIVAESIEILLPMFQTGCLIAC